MAKSDLRIDILGTVINISADEEPEYLQKVLEKYRRAIENVQHIPGIKDPLQIAVLTGFLLSEELEGTEDGAGLTDITSLPDNASSRRESIPSVSCSASLASFSWLFPAFSVEDELLAFSSSSLSRKPVSTAVFNGSFIPVRSCTFSMFLLYFSRSFFRYSLSSSAEILIVVPRMSIRRSLFAMGNS